ncbi:MAG: hypothetical protein JO038_05855 [Alphaproteobacteria bacterium]|nr:hypothetical protein [Alphaproteobacteria bacterium]
MDMGSNLLLLGCAALLMSAVLLPLSARLRAVLFAVLVGSVMHATTGSTVTDNSVMIIADELAPIAPLLGEPSPEA